MWPLRYYFVAFSIGNILIIFWEVSSFWTDWPLNTLQKRYFSVGLLIFLLRRRGGMTEKLLSLGSLSLLDSTRVVPHWVQSIQVAAGTTFFHLLLRCSKLEARRNLPPLPFYFNQYPTLSSVRPKRTL